MAHYRPSLNEYEKLKRKNRRRLVGATVMVVFAGGLLAAALSRSDGENAEIAVEQTAGQKTDAVPSESPVIQINDQQVAGAEKPAANESPNTEVPQPQGGKLKQTELDNPLLNPVEAQTALLADSEDSLHDTAEAEPAQTAKPAVKQPEPAKQAEEPEAAPPVVIINNRADTQKPVQADTPTAERKNIKQAVAPAETKKTVETPAKTVQNAKPSEAKPQADKERLEAEKRKAEADKRQAEQEDARKKEQKLKEQQAKAEAEKRAAEAAKKQAEQAKQAKSRQDKQESQKKNAQDVLNNKSAKAVAKDPQAILEGKAQIQKGKAIIQAGAYSNREQAKQVQQRLANLGISAYISEADTSKGKVYRVRTVAYPDRQTANKALGHIRQQGIDGLVIGQQ